MNEENICLILIRRVVWTSQKKTAGFFIVNYLNFVSTCTWNLTSRRSNNIVNLWKWKQADLFVFLKFTNWKNWRCQNNGPLRYGRTKNRIRRGQKDDLHKASQCRSMSNIWTVYIGRTHFSNLCPNIISCRKRESVLLS